ncbi:hypothetical protein [uncultured Tolumonas sp.]|uniref:hypothetical protein n=1 Tax=uncultured Tolumonas sp. TaxID=263765 RepID=UPI002A0A5187|nr:hypothetical protein [uncultured Tolumonas sp.]
MGEFFPVSLDEWNAALIESVFLKPSHEGLTLSRIDSTGQIFEQLKGSRSKEDAKRSFLNAFGKKHYEIQRHLKYEPRIDVFEKTRGIPPHFAILYLTLIAASADDDTHEEGDFRVRFSLLLGFNKDKKFIFSDLPKMWESLERWSSSKKKCARLILPDPQRETLIGYSKRLSFPSYKDEKKLRDLLIKERLDSHSSFDEVNKILHRQLSSFSEVFRNEVGIFNNCLLKFSLSDAYNSPLWGAVRDITLYEETQRAVANGHFCIQLDATNLWAPEIYLLMDDKCADILDFDKLNFFSAENGIYSKVYYEDNIVSTLRGISSILKNPKQKLSKSRVGMALLAGCLPLFRDDFGYVNSNGRYSDNDPVCLVVRNTYIESLLAACKLINLKFHTLVHSSDSSDWGVILFDSLNQNDLMELARLLPKAIQRYFIQNWMPARPYFTGGARYGQAILLNPASTPFVRMEGAIGGSYEISDSAGRTLVTGDLKLNKEGLYIPPEKLSKISGQAFCRYFLTLKQQEIPLICDIHVLDHAPYSAYRGINERSNWLTDGPLGILESLDDFEHNVSAVAIPPNEHEFIPLGGIWSLWQQNEHSLEECKLIDINAIPESLEWLAEALALRFQKRSTLPFDELKKHIKLVSMATGIHAWRLRRMLFAAGWLCVVESRYAPYQVVSMADRTISTLKVGQNIVARISGLLTKKERNQLQSLLRDSEQAKRWSVSGSDLATGCIELILPEIEFAELLAERFGLRFITRDNFPISPFSGVLLPISKIEHITALPPNINVAIWQKENTQWSEELVLNNVSSNALMRNREKQRNRYFISTLNGYWQTDSFVWGLMVQTIFSQKKLGSKSDNGDIFWSKNIISLPPSITLWWLHFGGGCLSINEDGNFSFIGGGGDLWGNINNSDKTSESCFDRALQRRMRAIKLRRVQ